jgi:RHS repeat-associated protein
VNGEWKAGSGALGNYMVYVNPYLVLKSGGYTKHYYIEGQRIASKIGGGIDNNGKGPLKAGNGSVDYNGKHQRIFDGIVKNLKFLGADGQILTAGKSGKVPPGQINGGTTSTAETFRYFYHPDHLGSTSYVTDAAGEVYQHIEYFAFGETFVEEHSNTDRTPFLFNGKELDEETGLYYYGARYYDAKTSIWLGVDKMTEKYPGESPYSYCSNNPVIFVDPDGNEKIVIVGNQGNSPNSDREDRKKNTGYKFGDGTRHFLQAGLDQARKYKKNAGDELVTMIIYKGDYSDKELDVYKTAAKKDGINVMVMSDDADVIDYVNKKKEWSLFGSTAERDADLISDFSFFGHGMPDELLIGGGSQFSAGIEGSDLNNSAFALDADIYLNACGSAFGELFTEMKEKTNGTVSGFNTTVEWGRMGIGQYEPNTKEYYFPWQDRESKDRKTLPANERTKTEKGKRTD